jgi:competence protein ComEC
MSAELRDRYARAGLVHILSISGFHVGVIAGWVALIGVLAGVPRARAAVGAAAVAFGYVMFLGWPAPAARAALLAGLVAQFHLRQRNPQAVSLLAVAALLVVLLDPWAVLDPGAWLSVAALAGALQATRWSDRAVGTRWWHRTAAASVGATVATAPITATLFGLVSLAGVLLNFIAVPLAAVAVPGLLLSLLLSAVAPSLAHPVAAGAGAVLGLLDQVAWWGGSWDASAVVQPAGPAAALPWLGILGLAGWSISGGTTRAEAVRRTALGLAAGTWLLLGVENYQAVRDATSGLTLHFLDVGQGDAALVRTPAGRWVLIDAGPRDERTDAGRRVVAPFLARHRVGGLAVAVLSHAHADHLGGFGSVLERYPASRMLEPAELVADSLYLGFLDELEVLGIPWQAARDGLRFELDSVRFTVLHPDTGWSGWRLDLNEDSVMLLVEYGAFRALFSGDAGVAAEARLAGRVGPVDLLKVGHHGSRSASGEAWLAELRPQAAIISSGNGNRYGHPHREVLERLVRRGIGVWRTDLQGTLTVTTDGRSFSLSGRGRHETIHTRGLSGAPE